MRHTLRVLTGLFSLLLAVGLVACSGPATLAPALEQTVIAISVQQTLSAAMPVAPPTTAAAATAASAPPTDTPTPIGNLPTPAETASETPAPSSTPDPAVTAYVTVEPGGSASGGEVDVRLGYPSSGVPPLRVTIYDFSSGNYRWIDTNNNQQSALFLDVPPGMYVAYAYPRDSQTGAVQGGFGGGFTFAVPCGLSVDCTNHDLIEFQVAANTRVTGVFVADWYAPEGTFPPSP